MSEDLRDAVRRYRQGGCMGQQMNGRWYASSHHLEEASEARAFETPEAAAEWLLPIEIAYRMNGELSKTGGRMVKLATAVENSKNEKTGHVHATYASQVSCPSSCSLLGSACYAEFGPLAITTARLNKAAQRSKPIEVAESEAHEIRETLTGNRDLRIHVVGDCKSNEAANIVSTAGLEILKPGRQPWSYTHAWRDVDPKAWNGVSVLASAEKPSEVAEANDKGWATAMVVDNFRDTKLYDHDGVKLLPCPNMLNKEVTCVKCRLCFNAPRLKAKGITIGFALHGVGRKRGLVVLDNLNK